VPPLTVLSVVCPLPALICFFRSEALSLSRDDVIGKDFRQGILIIRLQQVLDRARRQFRERLTGWSKDRKRAWAL